MMNAAATASMQEAMPALRKGRFTDFFQTSRKRVARQLEAPMRHHSRAGIIPLIEKAASDLTALDPHLSELAAHLVEQAASSLPRSRRSTSRALVVLPPPKPGEQSTLAYIADLAAAVKRSGALYVRDAFDRVEMVARDAAGANARIEQEARAYLARRWLGEPSKKRSILEKLDASLLQTSSLACEAKRDNAD